MPISIAEALQHPNKLGAGAVKRRKLSAADIPSAVMKEFYRGTLHSGSGEIVTNEQQAKAIAISEKRHKKR